MAGVPIIKATVKDMTKAVRRAIKKNPEFEERTLDKLANKKGKITPKGVRKAINAESEVKMFKKNGKLTKEGKEYLKQTGKEENFSPENMTWDDVFEETVKRNSKVNDKVVKTFADKFKKAEKTVGKNINIKV